MRCEWHPSKWSDLLDNRLTDAESVEYTSHLRQCAECSAVVAQLSLARQRLRSMPAPKPPAELDTSLRILASRERARALAFRTLSGRISYSLDSLRLAIDNLMRPIALPAAGGLASALVLFAMFVPNLYPSHLGGGIDVPTALYTHVALQTMGPFDYGEGDLVVDLVVDDQGRMVDYSLPHHPNLLKDPGLRRTIENNLLFARFTPATAFGQPTSGRIRVTLVNVRG